MIAITKTVVAFSALVSAGLVTAYDTVPQAGEQTAAFQVSQRFPHSDETFKQVIPATKAAREKVEPVSATKGDRLPISTGNCMPRGWPYVDETCLVSDNGEPVRKVSRVITIQRKINDNTSELIRMPTTELAVR